jgi:hypothetical protein
MAEFKDLLDEIKKQGELTRGTDGRSGNNSLKGIVQSLQAIRTVGGLGGGVVQVGAGSVSAAALTPAVPKRSEDPELGLGGLLKAAIRNQTVGRVERGAAVAKEAAAKKFQESFLGQGIARGREAIGERKESFAESLRGLAGLQTNAKKREIEEKQLEEQQATREAIEDLVKTQQEQLGLSQKEADNLRQAELLKRDLEAGGATPTAAMMGGASGGAAAGGRGRAGGGAGVKSGGGSGGGKMGGIIGKFFGGVAGGVLSGFVLALGNAAMFKASVFFAAVLPLIGVGLGGFVAAIGLGFAAAAAVVGKGLEILNPALAGLSDAVKNFEDIDADKISAAGDGLSDFFGNLPTVSIAKATFVLGKANLPALSNFAKALKDFDDVDTDGLAKIGPAVKAMGVGLAAAGLGELFGAVAKAIGGEGGGIEGQMTSLANGFRQFKDVDPDAVAKIGPAVKSLGEGLAAAEAGGFGKALGNLAGAALDFLGIKEKDPIEMFKRFAVLGEGEIGDKLTKAGNSIGSLGTGLKALEGLDTKGITRLSEDIIPPLTKLGNAFSSEVFMFGDENPIASTLKAFEGLKELENIKGKETKTKLISIGEGLEDFAKTLDDGEIETLAQYVREVAGPILALTGRGGGGAGGRGGGGAGGSGGSGADGSGGSGADGSGGSGAPRNYEAELEDARRTFEATGDRSAIENVQKDKRAGVYERKTARIEAKKPRMRADPNTRIVRDGQVVQEGNHREPSVIGMAQDALMQGPSIAAVNKALYGGDPFQSNAMYAKVIENLKNQGYSDEMLSPENFERATGKKGGGSISIDGKTYDMRAIGLYQNLKEEQMAKSRAINAGSNDVASAQRKEGAPTVVAPTNNNQSTTVNNVNNSSGGGGGGISARRPRQIRGGMYDQSYDY